VATSTGPDPVPCELIDLSTTSLEAVRTRPDSALSRAIDQVAEEMATGAVKAAGFSSKFL